MNETSLLTGKTASKKKISGPEIFFLALPEVPFRPVEKRDGKPSPHAVPTFVPYLAQSSS